MQYFYLAIILVFCGLAYVRFEQPEMWNEGLNALKVPEVTSPISSAIAPGPAEVSPPPSPVPVPSPVQAPTPPPTHPETIYPDSTNFINPDHVKQVEQPTQAPSPASSNAPSTNAPIASPQGSP